MVIELNHIFSHYPKHMMKTAEVTQPHAMNFRRDWSWILKDFSNGQISIENRDPQISKDDHPTL